MSEPIILTIEQRAAIKKLLLTKYFESDGYTREFLANYLKRHPVDEREHLEPDQEAIDDLESVLAS